MKEKSETNMKVDLNHALAGLNIEFELSVMEVAEPGKMLEAMQAADVVRCGVAYFLGIQAFSDVLTSRIHCPPCAICVPACTTDLEPSKVWCIRCIPYLCQLNRCCVELCDKRRFVVFSALPACDCCRVPPRISLVSHHLMKHACVSELSNGESVRWNRILQQ